MGNSRKKQEKAKLNKLCCNKVSITFFLASIAGINHPAIYRKELTHKEVKILFPSLKRKSFEKVLEKPSEVYQGEVIMVEDALGHIAPYENPHTVVELFEIDEDDPDYELYGFEDDVEEEIPDIHDMDLDDLSTYELSELLKIYHDAGFRGAYRKVHREIMSREDSRCSTKRSKDRVYRKEAKNEKLDY